MRGDEELMELYILILIEFIFFIVTYMMFDNDIVSPPVVTSFVLLVGTILIIPSIEIWETVISKETILVIFSGFISITIGAFSAKILAKRKYIEAPSREMEAIHCSRSIEYIILLLSVMLTILYLFEAIRVGTTYGGTGFAAIGYTKNAYFTDIAGSRMNMVIRQGFKVVMVFSYISAFLFANNVLVLGERIKRNWCYFIALLCGCAITIFSGSRTEILRIISTVIVCYSILLRERKYWNQKENSKSVIRIAKKFSPILLITVVIAFASRAVVKTEGTGGTELSNVVSYLSYYLGSPIQVLNNKLEYFASIKELWFGSSSAIPEFVYLGKLNYGGNVTSIFGSIVTYNGLIRMIPYLFLLYFLGTAMYYRLYGTYSSARRNRNLVMYAYIYFIFSMSYYSNCFAMLFEFSNYIILIVLAICFKPLLRLRIKIRR